MGKTEVEFDTEDQVLFVLVVYDKYTTISLCTTDHNIPPSWHIPYHGMS